MSCRYKIITGPESVQGSPEWLEFRRGKISASIAPIIMGDSPYMTPLQLFESIIMDKPNVKNSAMERGTRLEPIALAWLNEKLGTSYEPVVVQSRLYPDFIASLDGYALGPSDKPLICEIKCPGAVDHATALMGEVPKKYEAQLQHQMHIVGVDEMVYVSFDGKDGCIVNVKYDQKYAENLFQQELLFLEALVDMKPPKATDMDWVVNADEVLSDTVATYNAICEEIEEREEVKKKLKESICSEMLHPRVKIGKNKIQMITTKGTVDYGKLVGDLGIGDDVIEKYRKPSTQYWKIGY